MLVIYRADRWELIEAPQDVTAAWELADNLTAQTGIPHHVGRL